MQLMQYLVKLCHAQYIGITDFARVVTTFLAVLSVHLSTVSSLTYKQTVRGVARISAVHAVHLRR